MTVGQLCKVGYMAKAVFAVGMLSACIAVVAQTMDDTPEIVAPEKGGDHSLMSSMMPTYGNWCGADHPKVLENAAAPINLLDEACMRHDFCYVEKGYFSCECDGVLNQELIDGLQENKYVAQEKLFARSIHHYFNGSPCNGDFSHKVAPSRAVHNLVKHVSDVTTGVYNLVEHKTLQLVNKPPKVEDNPPADE